ncbi:MAG: trypsin-like peptidase domain-containing protein [Mobilicoccus sp.]|nr:trypsin-like peptidase domain-containing protein [Mobilicoccus sp.]
MSTMTTIDYTSAPDHGGDGNDGRDVSGKTPRPRRTRLAEIGLTALLAASIGSGATLATTGLLPVTTSSSVAADAGADAGSTAAPSTPSWPTVAAAASPSVVAVEVSGRAGSGQGSGVIWDDQGHVVTNNHVVASLGDGARIQVRIGQQTTYAATIVGTDSTTDLAVLQIQSPPADLAPLPRGTADEVHVGDPVMALGNPLGLSGTVTTGIVSALDRPTTTEAVDSQAGPPSAAQVVVTNAIQTSAAINPGNSGGALVDAQGRLIGINSSIASMPSSTGQSGGNIGIGFAVPVDEVTGIVDQLISSGTATHAALGIRVIDAEVPQGAATVSGAGVEEVLPQGAAATAGLRSGDVIIAVDDTPVTSAESLIGQVRSHAVGQSVDLTLLRDGSRTSVTVTLDSRSA